MTDLRKNPGESEADFITRIVAASRPPSAEGMELLRRLLPPAASRDRQAAVPARGAA